MLTDAIPNDSYRVKVSGIGLVVRTTVFRGIFFQILRASLPNSTAHSGKFTT